ncbi:Clavaminate synthase-like protein [Coniophora puteana RWD-64-598 SS2]|uniref:Clavaminate synthase-like protein n=1 Tax=Coniophora puteana (strain RWD-64-598) TaxID=741705 RepID=A0A5M3MV13_CONPW|nr:Clavaminate synthase-like protein [Coniophora puteana RWD-64-598 SS2]EIW82880.1 Clavaminate synthase-like protein [Coniophora puteana RWD-64-598 SS2]
MAANFSSVPILDYSLVSDPHTRPLFIKQLQHALVNVGFLYLKNHTVPKEYVDAVVDFTPRFFDLPLEIKEKISSKNSPHFLGYSDLGAEITKSRIDYREHIDFGSDHETQWKSGDPDYLRWWGQSQWPDESSLPGFRAVMERYLDAVRDLSYEFTSLLAEALGLHPDALNKFFDRDELMLHHLKLAKYPAPAADGSNGDPGVGPHYDAGFLTFLLQATPHPGLQVQNLSGEWIDAAPIPDTFVINIGKGLEFVTRGLARATSHRVLSPPVGSTPRYSVPFFQNISLHARLTDEILDFPPEILKLKEIRGDLGETESINFAEYDREPFGKVCLIGRIKSRPDIAARFYPELFKEHFPEGMPGQ